MASPKADFLGHERENLAVYSHLFFLFFLHDDDNLDDRERCKFVFTSSSNCLRSSRVCGQAWAGFQNVRQDLMPCELVGLCGCLLFRVGSWYQMIIYCNRDGAWRSKIS